MAVRLFFAGLIVLLVFLGCGGGGGGGGGSGSGLLPGGSSVVVSGTISGTIEIDQTISALRPDISSFSPSLRFLDSFVMIEELPNLSTRADQDGKFVFENVPFGTYRIIARVTSLAGRIYKLRTTAQTLTQTDAQKTVALNVTKPDLAENQIRMQIKDLNGNPIGKCKVWFWGEQFTLDASGYYVSPYMPAGAAGVIKVEPPADKELSGLEFNIPATTFNPDNIEIVGVTLPTAGITNKAPIVSITTGKYPEGGSAFLRLFGHYSDPEGEPMTTSWLTNVSTFTYVAKDYADWAVPSVSASVTVYFSASEDGRYYPRLTSLANLNINVASSGEVSFPGEILLRPVTRSVDIVGSSASQIAGNTLTTYEARTNFPPGLQLYYNWTVDRGTLLSSATESIISWRSPALSPGLTQVASIAVAVTDGIGTATKEIQVRITSVPTVTITGPAESAFEPGLVVFTGSARDYLNTAISPDSMSWYVATDTQPFVHGQTGGATFSWEFLSQGSYTVALQAFDANGVTGTGTKKITIINARPVCAITQPLNDASFRPNTPVTFVGTANDQEDGAITDATRLVWTSDIDGVIGSGTTFTLATMTSNRHEIRFSATDSGGAAGSTSIVIWYDVPARISFTPADRSVFFIGHNIPFAAVGTDTDNTPLDSSQFNWYLNDLPDIWRDGASFSITAGAYVPGANRVRVEGPALFETAVSPTHVIQMGWPVASITSPASGTRFEPLDVVSFAAVPDSTGTLALQWFLNDETMSFGSGSTANYAPPNGSHRVTYVGSDSQGIVSSSTINIVVERVPIVSFFPVNGSYLFTGYAVEFNATCLDSDNNDIADNRVKWLFNGSPWLTVSGKTFTRSQPAELASGTHAITLIASGPYGTVGSITNTITAGVPAASIISPASNATFLPGTEITFTGSPESVGPISMEWWANYGDPGAIRIGAGANVATNALPAGYHLISYIGSDSSGFVSSASRRIGVGQFPEMDFTPDDGTVFFGSQNVVFTGVGTDSVDGTIPGAGMEWYIDGALDTTGFSMMTLTPAEMTALGEGLKTVELRGTNTIGAVGVKTKQIYLGTPDAVITYPAYDTVIPLATQSTFTGVPDSVTGAGITDPLVMRWMLDGALLPTTGATLTYTLPAGIHYITFIGTDSRDLEKSSTIRVIVSNDPTVTFSPAPNSSIFTGKPFTLEAAGDVATATVKWSLDGGATVWKTGSPKVVAAGELAVGSYNISAEGTNAVGVVASRTNEGIFYGHPLLTIASPTSGITVPRSTAALVFEGSPGNASSSIAISWQHSDRVATAAVGGTAINNSINLVDRWNDITLTGLDVAGNQSVSTVSILRNDPPPLTISPADIASDAYFFAGRSVSFYGAGTSSISLAPVPGSSMKWRLSGAADKTGSSTVTYTAAEQTLPNQWRTLTLEGTDDLGTSNISDPIDVWFGCPLAVISGPASGSVFNPGQSVTFSGNIDTSYPITMEWYRVEDSTLLHTGNNSFSLTASTTQLPLGRSTIRYQGTDSSGFTSSATIQVLINASASMVINPGEDSEFFKNRNVVLSGYGTSLAGQAIATSTFKWFVNGVQKSLATNPVSLAFTGFSTGENLVRLEGTDEFGVVSSITRRLYYGRTLASIVSPASGTRFDVGANASFTAIDDTYLIQPEWIVDNPASTFYGTSFSSNTLAPGNRTVTYRVEDSSGFISSATIQVLVNNRPTMQIEPGEGSKFFAGRAVTVYGTGTSSANLPLAASGFKWFVNGSPKTFYNGSSTLVIQAGELTGEYNITLTGTDTYGTLGTTTASMTFGYTQAALVAPSPASGTLFDPDATVNFAAVPNSLAPIFMSWILNNATTTTGITYDLTLSPALHGWNTISYRGADSSGFVSSASTGILVNRPASMTISSPAVGSVFFDGSPAVTFTGEGKSYLGADGDITDLTWYVDGSQRATGNNVSLDVWMATAKYYDISLAGKDAFGTVGTVTQTIYYKYPAMAITSPESGWVRSPGTLLNLIGTSGLEPVIRPRWYIKGTSFLTDTTQIGTGSIDAYTLPAIADSYTITYIATDSAGFERSDSVQITVNATINPVIIPGEFSTFFAGATPITFVGSGTDANGDALLSTHMNWLLNDTYPVILCDVATHSVSFAPGIGHGKLKTGLNKLQLTASDTLGATNSVVLYQINYGHPALSILSPASGTVALTTPVTFTGVNASDTIRPSLKWYGYHHATNATATFATANHISSIDLPLLGTYTVSYAGTDTAGVWSTGTSMIFKNALPTVNFNSPASNSVFFVTRAFTLSADGTDGSSGAALGPASFTWYRDAVSSAFKSGFNPTVSSVDLTVGTHTLYVTGVDRYGTVGTSSVKAVYYGHPLLTIASPAADVYIGNPGVADIVFKGLAASDGIALDWIRNGTPEGVATNTYTISAASLISGWNTISYQGVDAEGNVSTANVQVLKSDRPSLTFTPASNSVVFAGRNFVLEAIANEALPPNSPITGNNIKWYRGAAQIATGTPLTITAGSWTVGTHTIYVTAQDSNGVVATAAAQAFYYGLPALTIASPSANIRVNSPAPASMDFVGSIASSALGLQWYLNGSAVGPANSSSVTITTLVDEQNNKIEYTGIDGAGNISTATVYVLVRSEPAMNIAPASGSHFFTVAGNQVQFTGSGAPVVPAASMTWQLNALAPQTGINPITFSGLATGWHTVKLTGTDAFGVSSYTTAMFYYGHPALSIASPTNNTLIASDSPPANVLFTGSSIMTPATIAVVWYYKTLSYSAGSTTWNPAGTLFDSGYSTIYYEGTDAAGTVSTASVVIRKRDEPEMFITPGNNSYFFTANPVTFTGTGLDVNAASMSWYLNGALSHSNTNTATFASLTVANHTLRLAGTDIYGIASSTIINIYGKSNAVISQPLAQRYDIGNIDLSGTPDSFGATIMEWYRDFGTASQTLLAVGSGPHSVAFPAAQRGYRPVTYLGTDDDGFVSSKTVQILVNTPPTMTIASPTAGGKYFGGQTLYFEGSGLNSAATPGSIAVASLTWYLGASTLRTATSSFYALASEVGTGTKTIRLEGKDEFGTVGSITRTIDAGLALPKIASPTTGVRIGQSVMATFSGSLDLTGNMKWYSDVYGLMGSGATLTVDTSLLARGWHTISYVGTDSASTTRSDAVTILIDDLPTFTPALPYITSSAKFADGPENGGPGNYIPIHLITPGAISVIFEAVAENGAGLNIPATPGTNMSWYLGAGYEGTGNSKTLNFENPGSFTVRVAATDEFNVTATATFVFWLWETETYTPPGLTAPASIIKINETNLAVADTTARRVYKLTRSNINTPIADRGDLAGPATATEDIGVANVLVDISRNDTELFVLASQNTVAHYFNRYNLTSFASTGQIFKSPGVGVDDALDDPKGIALDGTTAIYISDAGNNDVVKKFDLSGSFVSKSLPVTDPYGIKFVAANQIYVASNFSQKLFRYNNVLNLDAGWTCAAAATDATHLVKGDQKSYFYVTDPTGSRVNVIDVDGNYVYSFGSSGAALWNFTEPFAITIAGSTGYFDMYITDRTDGKIVRFRSNAW